MQHARLVTLLFTDIESSTRLLESSADAYPSLLERHRAILSAAADRYGGVRFGTEGDACFFSFDSATGSVAAAVESQRALALERWPGTVPVRVRMALHAGEVAELGDDRVGLALHHLARILSVAHGGQILVSHAAAELLSGLPPGVELRDLGTHRLRDVIRPMRLHQVVAEGIPASFPPIRTLESRPSNLPAPVTSFIGRDRELPELVGLVSANRLVTLTGPGGSGKTRVALEVGRLVADRYPDGVWLVELAGLGTGALVPEATLGALGVRESSASESPTDRLRRHLADRHVLLVLDNCEHVVTGAAALVSALLPASPRLHVLATSREPLRVAGETERPIPPLEGPEAGTSHPPETLADYDAVRLLVERAREVRPGFRITDANAAAVTEICIGLDGLPLALELAAARLRVLSAEQLAARLGDQLGLLTGGGRTRPSRQQTLRATLDWSYGLLDSGEQAVFERLSIFAGGFTLEAAECVAGGAPDAAVLLETLERLVSKSLVGLDQDRPEPRFRMLEPVRQYAAERLGRGSGYDEVVRRHRNWVVRFVEQASRGFLAEQRLWGGRLRDEQDNVRSALEVAFARGETEAALRIVTALGYPWFTMGQPDGPRWAARALAAATGVADRLRASVLMAAGMMAEYKLDYDRALPFLREALALFRQIGSRRGEALALLWIGRAGGWIDVGDAAASWLEEALGRFRKLEEPSGIGWALAFLADAAYWAGDLETAENRAAEALAIGTASRLLQVVAESQRILGCVAAKRGEHAESERLLGQAAAAYRQAGDRFQLAGVLATTAHVALERGDEHAALKPLSEALRLSREIGSGERMKHALEVSIGVLWQRRRQDVALLLGAAETAVQFLPRQAAFLREWTAAWGIEAASPDLHERRLAGRALSLERAVDRALQVAEQELAGTQRAP